MSQGLAVGRDSGVSVVAPTTGRFDEIARESLKDFSVPCEARVDSNCQVNPHDAIYMISFMKCLCPDTQWVYTFCEVCYETFRSWAALAYRCCRITFSPATDAITDKVRLRL